MDSHLGTGSLFTEAPDLSMPCRLMFDGSPLPMIAVAGARHIVCYVNPAFYGLTAKSDAELIGNPFAEIVIEEEFLLILEQSIPQERPKLIRKPIFGPPSSNQNPSGIHRPSPGRRSSVRLNRPAS